jgi:hypothetical protein
MQTHQHNHRPSDAAVIHRLIDSPLARQIAADMDREQAAAHDAQVTRAVDLRAELATKEEALRPAADRAEATAKSRRAAADEAEQALRARQTELARLKHDFKCRIAAAETAARQTADPAIDALARDVRAVLGSLTARETSRIELGGERKAIGGPIAQRYFSNVRACQRFVQRANPLLREIDQLPLRSAAEVDVELARMRTSLQQQIDALDSIELESTTQE